MAAAFRVSLEIKADPAVLDAIHALTTALGVVLPAKATSSVPTSPETPATRDVPRPASTLAHIAPPPPLDAPHPAPAAPPASPAGRSLSQVRDAAKLLNDRDATGRTDLVALLGTFGASSLANLAPYNYDAFVEKALTAAQK